MQRARYADRQDAGRVLAGALAGRADGGTLVLGLPRGGVVVAAEVAVALDAELDVLVVRKLGVPSQPELAMGAVGEDGARVLDEDVLRRAAVGAAALADVEARERAAVAERAARYRATVPRVPLEGRAAIVVDDGLATGSTARAACRVARAHGAARVVVAVPVAPVDAAAALRGDADAVVAVATPEPFVAVGRWYVAFEQVPDEEVLRLLAEFRRRA